MRGVLKREWFEIVDALPADLTMIRYWDTAFQKRKPATIQLASSTVSAAMA